MENIKEQLQKSYEDINKDIQALEECAVYDGIIDIDTYSSLPKTTPRILWILKEPNSEDYSRWSYSDLLVNDRDGWDGSILGITFRRVIYTSYGIIHHQQYASLPSIKEAYEVVKSIAYINLKKTPGTSVSSDSEIASAYQKNKELILKQINEYQPDILIFGNTMKYLFDDLKIEESSKLYVDEKTHNTTYYIKDNKLYIHAWHPAYLGKGGMTDEIYCDEIISIATKWWK